MRMPNCACGCGNETRWKSGKGFLRGHHWKVRTPTPVEGLLCDPQDADLLEHQWCVTNGYAGRRVLEGGHWRGQRFHRVVLERKLDRELSPDEVTDHINRNRLDNRRENLRPVSAYENTQNRTRINRTNTSGVGGVSWHRAANKWVAQRHRPGLSRYVKRFATFEEAVEALDAIL